MKKRRELSIAEARSFYDRFGARQDLQFYENPVIDALIERARLDEAHSVFELGFGTGRLAARLLGEVLPADASYFGLDISRVMVGLARERLGRWQDRAKVQLSDGSCRVPASDRAYDRFISTYVFDLLSEEQIRIWLAEAHRLLNKNGLLCLAGLTEGTNLPSRIICRLWNRAHDISPRLVGGCRPVQLLAHFSSEKWRIVHHEVIVSWGVPSEVLVASPLPHR